MKIREIFTAAGLVGLVWFGLAMPVEDSQAQTTEPGAEADSAIEEEMRAILRERERALARAVEEGASERSRLELERRGVDPALGRQLDDAVKRGGLPPEDPAEAAARKRAEAQLESAREGLSDEAKLLMALPVGNTPEVRPPAVPVRPAGFENAQPTQPERVEIAPKPVTNRVRITAAGAAEFDSRTGIAIFTEDVIVEHPGFYLECDVLEVHMSQEAQAEAAGEAEGAKPIPPPAAVPVEPGGEAPGVEEEKPGGGIKLAIAKGRMVMIKKKSEDGTLQVGHCRHAVFDGATGDITMRIWPQIQKGKELLKATSESTVILIKQDGRFTTSGGGVVLDANAKEN